MNTAKRARASGTGEVEARGDGNGMISFAEAVQKVRRRLDQLEEEYQTIEGLRRDLTAAERKILGIYPEENHELVILGDQTIEGEFGWVFFWTSRTHQESGDIQHALVGNAPFLVSRKDGSLHETGTALPIEDYIETFIRCGNPHG